MADTPQTPQQRRALLVQVLEAMQQAYAQEGRQLTWTETETGVALYCDGRWDSTISDAELALAGVLLWGRLWTRN